MKTQLLTFALAILASCSSLKKEDPEKAARQFLSGFQNDLLLSNDAVLSRFQVNQSREALLTALRVLQNKDAYINCVLNIGEAGFNFEGNRVKVFIPTHFSIKNLDTPEEASHILTLSLTRDKDQFMITEFDGESFFQSFSQLKNRVQWQADQDIALKEREPIYRRARELEAKYDSVIWFAGIPDQAYFYVTRGAWTNYFLGSEEVPRVTGTTMGLVDWYGNIVIPLAFESIGAINFLPRNLVEVKREGKVGYFDLARKVLVAEPLYDLIIPYGDLCIVRTDSVYGWLDQGFTYHPGFPSVAAEKWMGDFKFLGEPLHLAAGHQVFCEIPSANEAGMGILPMPSYLYRYGIFKEIEYGISTTQVPLQGWTEYRQTTGSQLERIGATISAIITGFRDRYLEGREEFYDYNRVTITRGRDTVSVKQVPAGKITMRLINGRYLEIKGEGDAGSNGSDGSMPEWNLPTYLYYSLGGADSITALTSNRRFPQTEFIQLDSSYLTGQFKYYDYRTHEEGVSDFLSVATLTYMRDEILASNGYRFPEIEKKQQFVYHRWYTPLYTDLQECLSKLSPTDRYNVDFLEAVLAKSTPVTL